MQTSKVSFTGAYLTPDKKLIDKVALALKREEGLNPKKAKTVYLLLSNVGIKNPNHIIAVGDDAKTLSYARDIYNLGMHTKNVDEKNKLIVQAQDIIYALISVAEQTLLKIKK